MDANIKNICLINEVQYKCRTCFDPGRAVYSLADEYNNTKTWRDLLNEVAQLDTNDDELLPKTICCKCLDKLISYNDFILQIQSVNKKYFQLLENENDELQDLANSKSNTFTNCLAESAIALPLEQYVTEFKVEEELDVPFDILSNSSDMHQDHGDNFENKVVVMDPIVFEDQDFSADDDVCDPNYVPTKVIRSIALESEPAVSGKRMRSTGSSLKLIFNPEFYVGRVMNTNGSTTAKCAACHKLIKGTREVTSNFISHLKVRHSELHKKYMRIKGGPSDKSTSQEAFEKKIIRFLVDCALPVSVVEKESFRDLFSGTGLKVMCQKTAMKRLDETYNSMVTTVQTAMSSSKYFCTTADIWSGNHRSFLGYTCHWLDQNFQRKSAALACKRIFGVHSAEKIAQMIGNMNISFGLNTTNIIMTITDNGSNFVKAFRDHGLRQSDYDGEEAEEDSEDEMPIFENAKYFPKHERCASHTLNLLATTDFQRIFRREQPALYIQHTMTIKKCHQLWKKCKWPKSSEVIQSILGSALLVPVVIRWNSLYDAILKLLQFKEKLHELANELTLPPFSAGDFQYLESYKLLMEPIAQTLDFLQGEANVKYGCIIPALLSLSNKLLKLSRKPEVLGNISSIAVQLEHQLRVRFKLYFTLSPEVNMAIAAAVLTPNVKMKWLRVIQKTSPDCTEEQISKRVLEVICTLFKNGFSYNATDMPNLNNDNSFYDFDDDEDDVPKTPVTPTESNGFKNAISNQFYAYINDPDPGPEIWTKYNILKEAFLLCNTPLTSSAPVERLFSFAGIINSPKRNSLSDFSFEKFSNDEINDTGNGNKSSSSSFTESDDELPTTSQALANKPLKTPQECYKIEKVGDRFLCPVCKKTFTLRRNCRRHLTTIHLKQYPFSCAFCGHHSTCKDDLRSHLKRAHPAESIHTNANKLALLFGDRLYSKPVAWRLVKCMLCNAIFSTTKKLRQHLESHIDLNTLHSLELGSSIVKHCFPNMMDLDKVKKIICTDILEKDWFKYYTVLNEYSYEVSVSDTEVEDLEDETVEPASKYNCELCSDKFSYKYQVFSHLKEEHAKNYIPLSCSRCKLKFISIKMYEQHTQTYCGNKYKVLDCNHCPAKFTWPENMKNHNCPTNISTNIYESTEDHQIYSSVREVEKNDDDDPLNEDFELSLEQLEEHKGFLTEEMNDTGNENESSSSSSESDDELPTTSQSLAYKPVKNPQDCYEIKKVDDRFICPVCKKTFTLRKNCRRHLATIHFKENTLACAFCGHHFTCKDDLKSHLKRAHPGESIHTNANKLALLFGDRLYSKPVAWRLVKCMLCNAIFSTTKKLRQHLESHIDPNTLDSLAIRSSIVKHWFPNMDLDKVKKIICTDILEKDWFKYYTVLNEYSYEVSVSDTEVEDLEDETVEPASKYNCELCSEKFAYKYQVFSHFKKEHAKNYIPLRCSQCKLKFISIKMYEQHTQTYCGNKYKVLLCKHCPAKFIWPENKKSHNCPTKISDATEDHQIYSSVRGVEKNDHDPFNEDIKLPLEEKDEQKRFLNEEMNDTGNGNESSSSTSSESELPSTSQSVAHKSIKKPQDYYEIKKVGNRFLCPECKKTFTLRRNCGRHIRTVHCKHTNTFACGFCGHHSTCKEYLSAHVKRAHPGESIHTNAKQLVLLFGDRLYSKPVVWRLVKCMLCDAIFSTAKKLRQHLVIHSDLKTLHSLELRSRIVKHWFPNMIDLNHVKEIICGDILEKDWYKYYIVLNEYSYEVSVSDTEVEDLEDESVERVSKYNCEMCAEKFSYKYQVFSHLKEDHVENDIPLSCSRCKLKFISLKMYQQHRQTYCHNKYKGLLCTHCPGKFIWPENMKNHNCPTNISTNIYESTEDHQICKSAQEVEKSNKYQKYDLETDNDTRTVLPQKIIRCGLCESTFENLRHLRQHMPLHADGQTGIDFKGCIYVKQFERSESIAYAILQQQIKNAYIKRQISCFYQAIDKFGNEMDISDSDSDSDSNIEDNDGENVKKAYTCDVCKDVYQRRKLLLKHQHDQHNDVTLPFTCKDCQQQFVSTHLLQQHLKRICLNEHRRIGQPCDICNMRFIWPNNMLVHKEVQHYIMELNSTGFSKNIKYRLRGKKELDRPKIDNSATAGIATSSYPTTAILIRSSSADIQLCYCFLCPKTFFDIEHLNAHLSCHRLIPSDIKIVETLMHSTWCPNGKKVIKCKICGLIFVTMAKLKEHFSFKNIQSMCTIEHHSLRNYSITNQNGFELHLELDSESEVEDSEENKMSLISYNCCICKKGFKRKYEITQHQRSMHNYELLELKCERCIFRTVSQKVLDYHKATQCFNVEKNYKCDQCNFKFMWQENLAKHIEIYHASKDFSKTLDDDDINMSICEESTKTVNNSNNDCMSTSEITTLKSIVSKKPKATSKVDCPICGISTIYSSLAVHIMRHKGEKPFKCNLCDMAFPRTVDLKKHQQTHTDGRHYKCTICKKLFSRPKKLREHLRLHNGELPFYCNICQKSFNKAACLNLHMRGHNGDKPYICDSCGKKFVSASYLKRHKEVTGHNELWSTPDNKSNLNVSNEPEPKENNSLCPICGVCLSSKESLKFHMKIHTGKNSYKCDICEKSCSRKMDLTTHRLTHFTDRPLKCTLCPKFFKNRSLLKFHMRVHTFEKPYQCAICSKKFNKKEYLNLHMRYHTVEKPF